MATWRHYWSKSHLVGIVRGGLGNQLFQLAAYRAIAAHSGKQLLLDASAFSHPSQVKLGRYLEIESLLERLGIETLSYRGPVSSRLDTAFHTLLRKASDSFPPIANLSWLLASDIRKLGHSPESRLERCKHVDGYFSEAWEHPFFAESFTDVLGLMSADRDSLRVKEMWMLSDISVHIRLGDMRTARPESILAPSRIAGEIRRYSVGSSPVIRVFSDEQTFATRELEREGVSLAPSREFGSPYETLLALSLTRRLIASASTFSWWAGMLAQSSGASVSFPVIGDDTDRPFSTPLTWDKF